MAVLPGRWARDPEAGWELVDVVRDLARVRTLDDVTAVVRVAVRRLTGADGASFVLRDGDLCRYVDEDAISPLWKGHSFPMDDCVSGWVMRHNDAVVIDDIAADDRVPHDVYEPTFVRSLAMVPICTTEPVGAIGAYWARPAGSRARDVEILRALADSAAVALENARLLEEFESRVAARTVELGRVNDELRELTASVAHDIRSPLTSVIGFASALADRYADELSPEARTMVAALERNAEGLRRFVVDLLDYLTAGTRDPELSIVDVGELTGDVVERLAADIDARGATVRHSGDGDGDRKVVADPMLLGQAVQNLVANALVHTPADRAPEVTIAVERVDGSWELSVTDNGSGVPAEDRDAVFQAFRRAGGGAGHGLGLAVCRRVAEHHGGDIVVRDAPGGGASFVLRLPERPAP